MRSGRGWFRPSVRLPRRCPVTIFRRPGSIRTGRGKFRTATTAPWLDRTSTRFSRRRVSSMAATPITSRALRPLQADPQVGSIRSGVASSIRAEGRQAGDVDKNAKGASWQKPNWPIPANGELVSALDGNWGGSRSAVGREAVGRKGQGCRRATLTAADVQQATRDSVRAIMMIRAYRMRGHLHAELDPLGIEAR
jgi:hypothetical protein